MAPEGFNHWATLAGQLNMTLRKQIYMSGENWEIRVMKFDTLL